MEAKSPEVNTVEDMETSVEDIETPDVSKEQLDEQVQPVVEETNRIAENEKLPETLNQEGYSNAVYEKKDTPEAIQKLHELGMFKNSNNWKEVKGEMRQFNKDLRREVLIIQLLGGTGAVALLEPTPLGEIAFGVALGIASKHSKIIPQIMKKEDVEKISKSSISSGIKKSLPEK